MPNPPRQVKKKQAHRRALAALSREHPGIYRALIEVVRDSQPEWASPKIVEKARSLLRETFPERFAELYEKEQKKLHIVPIVDDYGKYRDEVLKLYGGGNGLTISQVAKRVGISYYRTQKILYRAGIRPDRGPRRKGRTSGS